MLRHLYSSESARVHEADTHLGKVEALDPGPPGDLICVEEDGILICAGYWAVF